MKNIKRKIFVVFIMTFICAGMMNVVSVYAANLTLNNTEVVLEKGKTKKLKAVKKPAANAKVTWKTSNKFAVTVSKSGKIKAKNYGTAIITAKCKKKTATCFVGVPNPSSNVKLDKEQVSIGEGQKASLQATAKGKVRFYSENTSVATVTSKGVITGKNPGATYIVAYTSKGYSVCEVDVISPESTAITETETTNDYNTVPTIVKVGVDGYEYNEITSTPGVTMTLRLKNLYGYQYSKIEWSIDNQSIISGIQTNAIDIDTVMVNALAGGQANITAKVTDLWGNETSYTNTVYITNASLDSAEINLYTESAGYGTEQFVKINGMSEHSKVQCSLADGNLASYTVIGSKIKLTGVTAGTGVLTVTVDDKPLTCTIHVNEIVFKETYTSIVKGKTKQIKITGTGNMPVTYKSRNNKIAKVSDAGLVTAVSVGATYINVKIGVKTFVYRVEVIKKATKKIISRATYIVNNWTYSQPKRMSDNYYDCSSLVWKGYKAYKNYNKKLGSTSYALTAAGLFDYLNGKNQIVSYGFTSIEDMKAGDLIFYGDYDYAVAYSTPGRTLDIYHVAMYAGNGQVVEKGGQSLSYNGTYHIVGIGRVLN